jgi:hypothetical protein
VTRNGKEREHALNVNSQNSIFQNPEGGYSLNNWLTVYKSVFHDYKL